VKGKLVSMIQRSYPIGTPMELNGQTVFIEADRMIAMADDVWSTLQPIFTRDLRLGKINDDEIIIVRHYLELAHDCLQSGYPLACVTCLSRVAAVIEPSQSRGGWLRRLFNTLRMERSDELIEPKKRSLLGKQKEG